MNKLRLLSVYLSPKGRINRREYMLCLSTVVLLSVGFTLFATAIGSLGGVPGELAEGFLPVLHELIRALIFYVVLCLNAKRLHDIGRSGWMWQLSVIFLTIFFMTVHGVLRKEFVAYGLDDIAMYAPLLFILGATALMFVVCGRCKSMEGENRFGPPSLQPDVETWRGAGRVVVSLVLAVLLFPWAVSGLAWNFSPDIVMRCETTEGTGMGAVASTYYYKVPSRTGSFILGLMGKDTAWESLEGR